MLATEAIDGQVYRLIPRHGRPKSADHAICCGWNGYHTGILFLVYDDYGKRQMLLVLPTEEIEKV